MESSINSKTDSILCDSWMQRDAFSVSMTHKANFNNKITQRYLCAFDMFNLLDSVTALLIDLFFSANFQGETEAWDT